MMALPGFKATALVADVSPVTRAGVNRASPTEGAETEGLSQQERRPTVPHVKPVVFEEEATRPDGAAEFEAEATTPEGDFDDLPTRPDGQGRPAKARAQEMAADAPPRERLINLGTRCTSIDDFISKFYPFSDDDTLTVPGSVNLKVGTEARFVVTLVDRRPVLQGRCRLMEIARGLPSTGEKPRLRLRLLELDESSRQIHRRLLSRKRLMATVPRTHVGAEPRPAAARPAVTRPAPAKASVAVKYTAPTAVPPPPVPPRRGPDKSDPPTNARDDAHDANLFGDHPTERPTPLSTPRQRIRASAEAAADRGPRVGGAARATAFRRGLGPPPPLAATAKSHTERLFTQPATGTQNEATIPGGPLPNFDAEHAPPAAPTPVPSAATAQIDPLATAAVAATEPEPSIAAETAPQAPVADAPARLSLEELRRLLELEQAEQAAARAAAAPAIAASRESTTVDESFADVPRPAWMNTGMGLAKKVWVRVPPDARPTLVRHGYAVAVGALCFLIGLWVRGWFIPAAPAGEEPAMVTATAEAGPRIPAAPQPDITPSPSVPETAAPAAAPVPTTAPGLTTCTAKVTSVPRGAVIRWGGRILGKTPAQTLTVPCGTAEVVLSHRRFGSATTEIEATPEAPVVISERLQARRVPMVKLLVTSSPPDAVVMLGKRKLGSTPLTTMVGRNQWLLVRVVKPGHESFIQRLKVSTPSRRVHATLPLQAASKSPNRR